MKTMMTTPFDTSDWEPLVETLRSELQEYGGLHNLLKRQQDRIIDRQTDVVLELNNDIEEQANRVAALRGSREQAVRDLGERASASPLGSLRAIIPFFPEVVRPLLDALMKDINRMVWRNRQKARQNHVLLSRAMEITEQTLRVLQPENFTRTYRRNGQVALPTRSTPAPRYQAVG